MSLKYKIKKFVNSKSAKNGQYYARATMLKTITLDDIASEIEQNCSMKRSDVFAVLTELVEVMQQHLQSSEKVQIDRLGSFKLALKTYVSDSKDSLDSSHLRKIRVNFTPAYKRDSSGQRQIALVSGTVLEKYDEYKAGKNKKS